MRSTIRIVLILGLCLHWTSAEAATGSRFGTFRAGGHTFKISRTRMRGRDGSLGPRYLTITSPSFAGAQILLRRTRDRSGQMHHGQVLLKSQGAPEALARMTAALGHRMALGGKVGQLIQVAPSNTTVPQQTVLGRLVAMELGQRLPRGNRQQRRRRPPKKTNPVKPAEPTGETKTTHVTEIATQRGFPGRTVYVDNFSVTTEKGKDGGVIHHTDGSSVRVEGWRLRRILTGGPSNSYRGELRHQLRFH